MRRLLCSSIVLASLLAGCGGESTDHAQWWFTCNDSSPSYPTGEVTPTLPRAGVHLDQVAVRRDDPTLADALDACVRDQRSELRGADALRADRTLQGSGFWWGDRHVSAMRLA